MSETDLKNLKPSKLERIFQLKSFAIVISILTLFCGIIAVVMGTIRLVKSILILLGLHQGLAGIYLIEAVDTYLFSLVILVLGGGIFKLFEGNENTFKDSAIFSKINGFMHLKILLWETILLTLTVWCALNFFVDSHNLQYEQLILPISILLLSLALKFIKGKNH
ncbi:YqhA family protein [Gaetbulibacter aquiaggeris]|uniref:YqhA family protein n=1 Tax=Gaetbulibacter aquiaggeris TaxID=1735373 RepID=A0ABW7MM67_9FLAO